MSPLQRLRGWWAMRQLRREFGLGPDVSDEQIDSAIDNLVWRFASIGRPPEDVDMLFEHLSNEQARALILSAAGERVPATWWDR